MNLRSLRRAPAFSTTVVLTLALGIGAATAVFSAMDRLLLRSLPYADADRLVASGPVSLPNLTDWRAQSASLDGAAGFMTRSFGLRVAGGPVSVIMTGMVTSDLFRVLGTGPVVGRTFSEREETEGRALLVLTDGLWTRQFHRAPEAVGSIVQVNEKPYEIVGVLPPGLAFPAAGTQVDAYIPISHRDYGSRAARSLQAVGRLKPGVTLAGAQSELRAIWSRLAAAYPADNGRGAMELTSLDEAWKGKLRRPMLLLTAAALLLLAIVATNVVNLILARWLGRSREMDIRRALGAGLTDIARQSLTESLILCASGGALGMALAFGVLRALPTILRQPVTGLALDGRAVAIASAVGVVVTMICGLAPLFPLGRRRLPMRALVVGQVALSLMLLLSAGAFLRVFLKLATRDPGFDPSHVAYFGFGLPEGRYSERQMIDFHGKLRQRLSEIPGVEAAGAVWRLPLNGRSSSTTFQLEGAGLAAKDWPAVAFNLVDPAYFAALRIPLVAGRRLEWERDSVGHPPSLVVNRAFEKAYGGVGRRLQLAFWTDTAPKGQIWEIVGVVADTYQAGLDQTVRPQIYFPIGQTGLDGGSYVIRTARSDADLATAVAAAVRSVDPSLERINLRLLDNWVRQSLGDRRLPAILTGVFAAIGLALTMLGLYGTMALEVGRRRKEMAIRVALGASRGSITGLVLGRGLLLTIVGTVAGAAGFVAVGRAIESQLYEVSPADPLNAAVVVLVLFACAVGACLRPAWDALRQQPISILREM